MTNEQKVLDQIRNENIEFIRAEIADMNGISRGFTLDAQYFARSGKNGVPISAATVLKGFQFDTAPGTGLPIIEKGANTLAYPDHSTFRILPWLDNTASILMDYDLHSIKSPRIHCMEQLKDLEELDLSLYSAFEYEFYLVDKKTNEPLDNDPNKLALLKNNVNIPLAYDLMRNLRKVGIDPECMQAESGPGQWEITIAPKYGIEAVDNAFRYKHIVKEISLTHGYLATFMPKPYREPVPPVLPYPSGAHFNHSLWSRDRSRNVMFNDEADNSMSDIAKHWIAGLQYHSKGLVAISSPTINCYRRYSNFIPANNTWGVENRTTAFRWKSYSEDQTYVENRMPSSAVNPYLLTAAVVIAGMDGIKRELDLNEALRGCSRDPDSYPPGTQILPTSLKESLECLQDDKILCDVFGGDLVKHFALLKSIELDEAGKATNDDILFDWEKEYYFTYA